MCGHVGIAGKLEFKDEATMKRLLVFDYFRGPDSTGFSALRSNKEVKLVKVASNPIDLFDMKRFGDALSGHNSTVFLGHNRLATKGIVNNVNAHPYSFDKADGTGVIVGAHNGTLDQSSWKALETAVGETFSVDSMAIIAAIAKLGIEATVPLLQGAWALVWFDTGDNTINFLRNKERPFWFAYTKNFDHLFWASEWPTIQAATALSANKYDLYESEGYHYWASKEDWWYKFDIDKLKAGATERPKPRVKELKGKEPIPAHSYTCGGTQDPFHRKSPTTWTPTKPSTTTALGSGTHGASKEKAVSNVEILHIKGNKKTPFGPYLTKEEFDKIGKYGCSWCQADVEYDEPGVVVYASQDMILCPECAGSEETSRLYVDSAKMHA